ncbi:Por secretion system C-terminal sorting domain-containing protein [Bizionia echini]|uniref:Por secretion system C-terminal sorting domain-containing protein n=1 Tax=Bizionia echini TaxID=649333 RepID=A0A1I4YV41_9FLAO|nr:T9SS type A sorting domain-containing protein [Bizionia echini]SFN41898.1 Por secretion system C-terminal sorting domain-containing protein [Bizionia echini]
MSKNTFITILVFLFFYSIGFAQLQDKNLSNQEENMEHLSVYPNPVSNGKLYVVTKNNFTKQVEIYNVLGKKIVSETLSGKELNISKIKPGIYIIKITENAISATRKLIVK